MKRKSMSQLMGEVDQDLKVVPRGHRRRRRGKNLVKLDEVSRIELPTYVPRQMTGKDWDAAGGQVCPRCRQECVKLVSIGLTGKIKMCPACMERRRRLLEHKRRLTDLRYGNARARVGNSGAIS